MKRLLALLFLSVIWSFEAKPQNLVPNAEQTFVDQNGAPLAAGQVFTYAPGTTVPKTTYVDPGLTTANPNPIILDGAGRTIIWGTGAYREIVLDQFGNQQWDLTTLVPVGVPTSTTVGDFACWNASDGSTLKDCGNVPNQLITLTSPLTLFFSTSGFDNASCGLTQQTACASASQAYLNLEHQYNTAGQPVLIQGAAGIYTAQQVFDGPVVGGGTVTVGGTSQGSVQLLASGSASCITARNYASVILTNILVSQCNNGIVADFAFAKVSIGTGVIFGTLPTGISSAHMATARLSYMEVTGFGGYQINGQADYHIAASNLGNFRVNQSTVGNTVGTLTTNVTFAQAFAYASSGGTIIYSGFSTTTPLPYNLASFTVTGLQWECDSGGVVQNLHPESSPSFFPGNAVGKQIGECHYNESIHVTPVASGFPGGTTLTGTDYGGVVVEAGGSTGGTVTFQNPFPSAPFCQITYLAAFAGNLVSISASNFVVSHAAAGPTFTYRCKEP